MPTQKPRTTIYLEPELFQALEERAKEEKRTISNLCNLLIEQAMTNWIDQRSPQIRSDRPQPQPPTASKANGKGRGKSKQPQNTKPAESP